MNNSDSAIGEENRSKELKERFRDTKYLFSLTVGILLFLFTVDFWRKPAENDEDGSGGQKTQFDNIIKAQTSRLPIDFYILRDSSRSADDSQYDAIEREIISFFDAHKGDRISYAHFGSTTSPTSVEPASESAETGYWKIKKSIGNKREATTDFEEVFKRLLSTFIGEWDKNQATGHGKHRDVVFLITDGRHDPDNSLGRGGRPLECPSDLNGGNFVPQNVRATFDSLVNASWSSRGDLWTFMLLAGVGNCSESIRQEWESALHLSGINVILFSESTTDSEINDKISSLLADAQEGPWVYIDPKDRELSAGERERLDKDGWFVAEYIIRSVKSNKSSSRVKIKTADLLDNMNKKICPLFVREGIGDNQGQSGVEIKTDRAEKYMYLRFRPDCETGHRFNIQSNYRVKLTMEDETNVHAGILEVPKRDIMNKLERAEKRRNHLILWPTCFGTLYYLLLLAFKIIRELNPESKLKFLLLEPKLLPLQPIFSMTVVSLAVLLTSFGVFGVTSGVRERGIAMFGLGILLLCVVIISELKRGGIPLSDLASLWLALLPSFLESLAR